MAFAKYYVNDDTYTAPWLNPHLTKQIRERNLSKKVGIRPDTHRQVNRDRDNSGESRKQTEAYHSKDSCQEKHAETHHSKDSRQEKHAETHHSKDSRQEKHAETHHSKDSRQENRAETYHPKDTLQEKEAEAYHPKDSLPQKQNKTYSPKDSHHGKQAETYPQKDSFQGKQNKTYPSKQSHQQKQVETKGSASTKSLGQLRQCRNKSTSEQHRQSIESNRHEKCSIIPTEPVKKDGIHKDVSTKKPTETKHVHWLESESLSLETSSKTSKQGQSTITGDNQEIATRTALTEAGDTTDSAVTRMQSWISAVVQDIRNNLKHMNFTDSIADKQTECTFHKSLKNRSRIRRRVRCYKMCQGRSSDRTTAQDSTQTIEKCGHCGIHQQCLQAILRVNQENMMRIEDLMNCVMCEQKYSLLNTK